MNERQRETQTAQHQFIPPVYAYFVLLLVVAAAAFFRAVCFALYCVQILFELLCHSNGYTTVRVEKTHKHTRKMLLRVVFVIRLI